MIVHERLICLFLVVPTLLAAQSPSQKLKSVWADSAPAQIIARPPGAVQIVVVEVLRQIHQPYSAAKRRELADSATQLALRDSDVVESITTALAASGESEEQFREGTPDRTVLARLIEIHRRAVRAEARYSALSGLFLQVDAGRGLDYLETLVSSTDSMDAYRTISHLSSLVFAPTPGTPIADRERADAILHRAFDQKTARTTPASVTLCEIAIMRNWAGASRCRGVG